MIFCIWTILPRILLGNSFPTISMKFSLLIGQRNIFTSTFLYLYNIWVTIYWQNSKFRSRFLLIAITMLFNFIKLWGWGTKITMMMIVRLIRFNKLINWLWLTMIVDLPTWRCLDLNLIKDMIWYLFSSSFYLWLTSIHIFI
jgi:hypothetical protein